jgi:hypothetical protein
MARDNARRSRAESSLVAPAKRRSREDGLTLSGDGMGRHRCCRCRVGGVLAFAAFLASYIARAV